MKRMALHVLAGFALGLLYFLAAHSLVVGTSYRLILERESALALLFRGLPVLAVVISLYIGVLGLNNKRDAFGVATLIAVCCLLPIPLAQYVLEAPRLFGMSRTSGAMLADEAVALIALLVAAVVLGIIAAIVSAPLGRAFGKWAHRGNV
jgi:hypothetical protein